MNNKKRYLTIIIAIAAFAVGAVVVGYLLSKDSSNTNTIDTSNVTTPITALEIEAHNTKSSCWMTIDGSVYDVTEYIKNHPGGNEIVKACGMDATNLFNGQKTSGIETTDHSKSARNLLKQYKIGVLSN